jgi:hypothetical protein
LKIPFVHNIHLCELKSTLTFYLYFLTWLYDGYTYLHTRYNHIRTSCSKKCVLPYWIFYVFAMSLEYLCHYWKYLLHNCIISYSRLSKFISVSKIKKGRVEFWNQIRVFCANKSVLNMTRNKQVNFATQTVKCDHQKPVCPPIKIGQNKNVKMSKNLLKSDPTNFVHKKEFPIKTILFFVSK